MPVLFTNLSVTEFQIRYLALFLLFAVTDGFKWFWMGRPLKNIQLVLELLKTPFLVLHFSYYNLMTFIDDVFCDIAIYPDDTTFYSKSDQASNLWQQLELASEFEFEILWTGVGSGLLVSMLEKHNWFCLTSLITLV